MDFRKVERRYNMSFVGRSGETLARLLDRRRFLKGTAGTLFSLATASAIRIGQAENVYAAAHGYCPYKTHSSSCNCHPTMATYCNVMDASYCSGYKCGKGCTSDHTDWSATGCWCTQQCTSGPGSVYYVCCDCKCPGGMACTCAHAFSNNGGYIPAF
jgi:hypothetical protein